MALMFFSNRSGHDDIADPLLERIALVIEHRAAANVPQMKEGPHEQRCSIQCFALIAGAIIPTALVVVVLLL